MNWSSWFWRWIDVRERVGGDGGGEQRGRSSRATCRPGPSRAGFCAWSMRSLSVSCSLQLARRARLCVVLRRLAAYALHLSRTPSASAIEARAVVVPFQGPCTMMFTAGVKLSFVTAPATGWDEAWPLSWPDLQAGCALGGLADLVGLDQRGGRDRRGAEGARDGRAAGRRVRRPEADERLRAVARAARGRPGERDRDGDDDRAQRRSTSV